MKTQLVIAPQTAILTRQLQRFFGGETPASIEKILPLWRDFYFSLLIVIFDKIIIGMVALDKPKIYQKKRRPTNVPEYLIYEIIDGKPYYRKGYKDVLNKTKTLEEIMGCSSYQWMMIEYLLRLLFTMPSSTNYKIATNEPGLHLDRRNNLAGDILVFNKRDLPAGSAISVKYTAIPALLHIEVDVAVDLEDEAAIAYLEKKVNKLLAFGTGRVIWIFTQNRRVLIAAGAASWQWHGWDETLPLINEVNFNMAEYLKGEGVDINR